MINLDQLNPEQREAVITTNGPLLILAGAGSGKTKALTYRIAYLIDSGLAGPDNILAVTFTNKAAGEMKARILNVLKETSLQRKSSETINLTWMGTFHSICVKILKKYATHIGLNNNFSIYDISDQLGTIKEAMKNLNISIRDFNPNAIHSYISSAKNELIDADTYSTFAQGYFQGIVAEVYPEYQRLLRHNNALDFDDLLMLVVKLFNENKNVLEHFQNQFKYILVDEYQDTNHAQYFIVNKLAEKFRNICCVGDDDQSIYSFRGATIKNILSFEKDYPEAKIIKLEQNYRSTKKILSASYAVISKNKARKDKKLWTINDEGENIALYTAFDEVDEASWIIKRIKEEAAKLKDESEVFKRFAILYRTNAQSRSLEEGFIQEAVPYKIIGGVRFYERKEIKDIIAYLRLIYNIKDNKSLERIINVPKRNIGIKSLSNISALARGTNISTGEYLINTRENTAIKNDILKFGILLNDFILKSKQLSIVELINYILEKSGYIEMLKDGTLENESRIENLKELISVASKHLDSTPELAMESFLNEIALLEGFTEDGELKDYVTLMTIHSAKGLEFEHVFVVGMEENLFPHSNSMLDEKEMEEERRLAYVAITRAKHKLYITHAVKRRYFGITQMNLVSRFVNDITKNLIDHHAYAPIVDSFGELSNEFELENLEDFSFDFKVGDKVKHEYFGQGVIKSINGSNVNVDFGGVYGIKELMMEYARLFKL